MDQTIIPLSFYEFALPTCKKEGVMTLSWEEMFILTAREISKTYTYNEENPDHES
jgi:hypothetical protein